MNRPPTEDDTMTTINTIDLVKTLTTEIEDSEKAYADLLACNAAQAETIATLRAQLKAALDLIAALR